MVAGVPKLASSWPIPPRANSRLMSTWSGVVTSIVRPAIGPARTARVASPVAPIAWTRRTGPISIVSWWTR